MSKLLVGRYELIEKIGEGGMAVVYKSRDRLLNRLVAIKILRPEYTKDAQFVDSFRKESQAAAGLQHPNIVGVYDVGKEGNIHFIVMELIDGQPLSNIIKEQAPMDYRRAIDITKQMASALSLAHKHNIIHRDIKPHNIMITKDGVAKLGDFGIAKAVSDSTLSETSKIIGSVHYFSPEQARGAYVDERSDLYSLGIVLYEMLTGTVPFDGDNPVQVALMHINDEITPPSNLVPGIPPALEKLVMKATDKYQSNRYRDADEMLEDLKNVELVSNVVGNSVFAASGAQNYRRNNYDRMEEEAPPQRRKKREYYEDDDDYEEEPRKKKKDEKKKKKKWPWVLAILVLLVAVGVGAAFATGMIGGKIVVPDVTEMTYAEAKAELARYDLKIKKGDKVTSDTIEEGLVAKQNPKAHTKVEKDTIVVVNISAGKATMAVPNLVGGYYGEETTALVESKGFTMGSVKYAKSDDFEEGQIISQDPQADAVVEEGTKINIVVCNGKKTEKVIMPALNGLTYDEAKSRLSEAGLSVGGTDYEESTVYSKGYVMWQQYDAGTELKKGTKVSLKISKGAPKVEPEPEPVKPDEPTPAPEDDQTDQPTDNTGEDTGTETDENE